MHQYEEFLDKVKSKYSDEFAEMNDILTRYDILKKTNKSLVDDNQQLQETLDKLINDESTYEKDQTNEILRLSNEIAELQKDLEKAEDDKNKRQKEVEDRVKSHRIQSKQLSQVVMAINNLYWKCEDGRKPLQLRIATESKALDPYGTLEDALPKAEQQLEVIGEYIRNYEYILKDLEQENKTHGSAAKKPTAPTHTKTAQH